MVVCQGSEDKSALVRHLYLSMRTMENRVGGGEGIEGIYGSITESGVSKIMRALVDLGGMDPTSTLVDVGSGLCRPLLHAMVAHGVTNLWGIEVDPVKCQKAKVFVEKTLEMVKRKVARAAEQAEEALAPPPPETFSNLASLSSTRVDCCSIEGVRTLDPATHVYTFWEGIPIAAKEALGSLFCQSKTCQAIALVQRALRSSKDESAYLSDLNFADCEVVKSFPVAMSGSGRQFRAYIVRKVTAPPGALARQPSIQLEPALAHSGETNEEESVAKGRDNGARRKTKSNGANPMGDRIRFKKIKKIKKRKAK